MQKIRYTLRFNRKKQLNKNGRASIQIECYLNGLRKYFDTKIKVTPSQWHEKTKTIKDTPNAIQQNSIIKEMIRELESYEIGLINAGKVCTLDMLENAFAYQNNNTFNKWFKLQIEKETTKKSTKRVLYTVLNQLNSFNSNLSFSDIDFKFLKSFERFLIDKYLKPNTISIYLKVIKKFVRLAINNDFINSSNNPFRAFKISMRKTDKTFLLPSEIDIIENLNLENNKRLKYARDLFLFSCYTGLRFSDVVTLEPTNIQMIDGKKWLIKNQQKTDEKIKIPIYLLFDGKPLKIIQNYFSLGSKTLFKSITNNSINAKLKRIFALAGIDKHVTFHAARHTTATYLLSKGVSIFVVQKILGHSKIDTTQIYTHLIDETIINSLKDINFSVN
jgi:hypothetical protein